MATATYWPFRQVVLKNNIADHFRNLTEVVEFDHFKNGEFATINAKLF